MIHFKDHWAVVTGASSGLGRGLAARLADRGMSLVLTGRNEARLDETAMQIRRAAPRVQVETIAADLSTRSGVSALLGHVGDRPIELLVNNAGFGSYGPFAEADADREADEVALDVGAVVTLPRAFLPGMLARRSGGILNVASTIAFQPAPYQAVYFAIVADASGLHAERTFTLRPTPDGLGTVVISHETQVGLVPWLGRLFLAPRLHAANQAMFEDLARAAAHGTTAKAA